MLRPAVGVSHSYVQTAKAIREKAPEVFERVKMGEMTLLQGEN